MAGLGRMALAALGILAYQNRDKLSDMLKGLQQPRDPNSPAQPGGFGGLNEILDKFRNAGSGSKVDSWVGSGSNEPIDPMEVERAIDPETMDALTAQTGLSREQILERLALNLPEAVNEMTPEGSLPAEPFGTDAAEPTLLDTVPVKSDGP